MKVTEDCLFMRTSSGRAWGGRGSWSWICTLAMPLVFALLSLVEDSTRMDDCEHRGDAAGALAHYLEHLGNALGMTAVLFLGSAWTFFLWRLQLPIIFNRKTRKVACILQGKWVYQSWDHLQASIEDRIRFAAGRAPAVDIELTLLLPYANPDRPYADGRLRIGIAATRDHPDAIARPGIYGAAQVWEYIRLYMQEGAAALPPNSSRGPYRLSRVGEAVRYFNPLKALKVSHPAWLLLAVPFFVLVALPVAPLLMLGDVFYMGLERILPRRRWPKELIDACDGIWDGRED
ncbi:MULTISPECIES: hypothetical protein [unclassified Cupriavidus]|uniref:hypothetical protein n=1 Tax=unclassified Cupriavidus TaxID=2640874 RepID=UPI0012EAA317|nr:MULTISPECIES: hypothetical protein [unclassified Cupriavidus]